MRALVTGAAGFAGRHLVEHLRQCGDEVVGLGHDTDLPVDVTDPVAVRDALAKATPQVVYHLAGLSHVGDSWDAPQHVFRVNAEGTLNVLGAAVDVGVERVLVVGSADEYGAISEADLPVREDTPLRPATPYGASKVAAEYLGLQAFLGDGIQVIRVRAFNHTGPGQSPRFVVPAIARRIAEAERGGGGDVGIGALEPVRDFSDVRDVVRAYRLLVERGEAGDVYNVCSGAGHSVREVVERLTALAGAEIRPVIDPALVRPLEVPSLVGDNMKLRTATGWEPEYSFDDTLAAVLDDQRARLAAAS